VNWIFVRIWKLCALGVYFVLELVVSSFKVAWDVITPRHRARPGILAVPLDVRSDAAVTVLANLVSLTPGSLSLDVSEDRSTLFVHALFIGDVEGARAEIKEKIERRVKEALE
jgi:multicomponent Na+:H+ antiporter subunit E